MAIAIIIVGMGLLVGTFLHCLINHHPDDGPAGILGSRSVRGAAAYAERECANRVTIGVR
jgi:hypothetical protein